MTIGQDLISSYFITETIANNKTSWLLNKFSLSES